MQDLPRLLFNPSTGFKLASCESAGYSQEFPFPRALLTYSLICSEAQACQGLTQVLVTYRRKV